MTQATRIYDSYLGPDAPKRIELPAKMLGFVQEEVGGGSPNINVFGAAHAWVYRRLRQTWYPAFLLSSTYQSLLEHLKKVRSKSPFLLGWDERMNERVGTAGPCVFHSSCHVMSCHVSLDVRHLIIS